MGARRPSLFTIRTKLLLVTLALLLIPLLGYQYVRELRSFLLQGQEDALMLTARAVSTVLHERTELFHPETGVPRLLGEESAVYAHSLANYIRLDGEPADWGEVLNDRSLHTSELPLQCTPNFDPFSLAFEHVLGYRGRYLYALFQVRDDATVFRDLEFRRLDNSDHLRLTIQEPGGHVERYLLTAQEPGRMSVYLVDDAWRYALTGEPVYDIAAELRETDAGYSVEVRVPRYLVSSFTRVAFQVADVDDPEQRKIASTLSTAPTRGGETTHRVLVHSPELAKILRGLDRPAARIWILDNQQRVRAVVGSLTDPSTPSAERVAGGGWLDSLVQRVYGTILSQPVSDFQDISTDVSHRREEIFRRALEGTPQTARRPSKDERAEILMAAFPVWAGDEVLGAVAVEQSSGEILALQDRVLKNVVAGTLIVLMIVTLALLTFASRLTLRIRRLRDSAETAIDAAGRVRRDRLTRETHSRDELGDLSRSISGMLGRLSQYTRYLEALPDTLAHELSNPLNVVNSSLDNLEKDVPGSAESKYMGRAKSGLVRLRSILTNITEAANLEDAMNAEPRERFDLVELVSSYVEGYRIGHPDRRFELEVLERPLPVEGVPDLLAQLLDKLADNAVDFSTPGSPIVFRLERAAGSARLSVLNEGTELPADMREELFDPMVSVGRKNARKSHLGLGLYVVRLIANYHQGEVEAHNRSDCRGVCVSVKLPLV